MKSSSEDDLWIKEELSKANFSDIRLNKRFHTLAQELAAHPSLPINHASTDWTATKVAYRFFNNPKVSPNEILNPHFQSAKARLKSYKLFLSSL